MSEVDSYIGQIQPVNSRAVTSYIPEEQTEDYQMTDHYSMQQMNRLSSPLKSSPHYSYTED